MVPYVYHKAVVRRLWAKLSVQEADHTAMVEAMDQLLQRQETETRYWQRKYRELEETGETFFQRVDRERRIELEEEVEDLYRSLEQSFEEQRKLREDRAYLLKRIRELEEHEA